MKINKDKKKRGLIPIFIPHYGCPHICVFCNQLRIGGVDTVPTATKIDEMIREFTETDLSRQWEVAFYGGSFTAIPKEHQLELLEPARMAKQEGRISHIRCSTRPDAIEKTWIEELKARGLDCIELGVQSMNNRVLEKAKRGHTKKDVYEAVATLRNLHMKIGLQLMPGLPGENIKELVETAVEVGNLHPDFVRIYPVIVIEETELAKWYERGLYTPQTEEEAVTVATFLKTYWERKGITVIRTGLQATEELDTGTSILAGPYAPSMGEMVVNYQVLNRLYSVLKALKHCKEKKCIHILYSRSDTSKVRGVGNRNKKLVESFWGKTIFWKECNEIPIGQVHLLWGRSRFILPVEKG